MEREDKLNHILKVLHVAEQDNLSLMDTAQGDQEVIEACLVQYTDITIARKYLLELLDNA